LVQIDILTPKDLDQFLVALGMPVKLSLTIHS
jgi:hypothetical protein